MVTIYVVRMIFSKIILYGACFTVTSLERHEARYQRRKVKREQKRKAFAEQFSNVLDVFGTVPIIKSAKLCKQGTNWKPSVQSYNANLVINSRKSSKAILNGKWKTKGFYEFDIVERGKPRHIKSVSFDERCIQRSLCDNYVTPILSHYLIYDNGATLPNKGTDFALDRFTKHLRSFYRRHGLDGYIYFWDFSGYFASILIEKLRSLTDRYIPDTLMRAMYQGFINVFGLSGLGLGSQVSQISAVFFMNKLDHLLKDRLGIKECARYMDDGYVIEHSLKKLKRIVSLIEKVCEEHGIKLNKKKCHIISLRRQFRFLKVRFFITNTGKVVRRMDREVSRKERNKLRKFENFIADGRMSKDEIEQNFHSWLYSQKRGANYHILYNAISYHNSIYGECKPRKPKNPASMKQWHMIKYICKDLARCA